MTLVSMFTMLGTVPVGAANRKVGSDQQWVYSKVVKTSTQAIYGMNWWTNSYKINGATAYCLNPSSPGPEGDNMLIRYFAVGNANLKKAIYYYENGDLTKKMNEIRKTRWLFSSDYSSFSTNDTKANYLFIHYTMALIYDNKQDWSYGLTKSWIDGCKELKTYIEKKSTVPSGYIAYYAQSRDDSKQTLIVHLNNKLTIEKKSSVTGEYLKGATFTVYFNATIKVNGKNVAMKVSRGTYTTGSNGKVTTSNLPPGNYIITETKAPPGYSLNSSTKTVTLDAKATKTQTKTVTFENDPYIKLKLAKVSSNNEVGYTAFGDAVYGVYTNSACTTPLVVNGENVKITTNKSGVGTYRNTVPYGKYYCKEISAPQGFALSNRVYQFVDSGTVDGGFPVYTPKGNGTVSDTPLVKFQLLKGSANEELTKDNDCYSLEGAEYGIYTNPSCTGAFYSGKIVTDADGYGYFVKNGDTPTGKNSSSSDKGTVAYQKISGSELSYDGSTTYYCKEIKAPKGYDTARDSNGNPIVYTFKNAGVRDSEGVMIYRAVDANGNNPVDEPLADPMALGIQKRDSVTGATTKLQGAIFRIQYYATMIDADVNVNSLSQVSGLDSSTLKRTWYIETGSNGLAGLDEEWVTSNPAYSSDEFYTDTYGDVSIPLGTVVIQEVKAPEGYEVNKTLFCRRVDEDGINNSVALTIDVDETPSNAYIGLTKMNSDYELVGGAMYGLYTDSSCKSLVATVFTDGKSDYQLFKSRDGDADGNFLAMVGKTYYIKEISAPTGYTLDTNVYPVTPTIANSTVGTALVQKVFEDTALGNLLIEKDSEDGIVEGLWFAVIDLTNDIPYPAVSTNSEGKALVTGLPVYDKQGNKIKYRVMELGFRIDEDTPTSYGGYSWTINGAETIGYEGHTYEGLGSIFNCTSGELPEQSRYLYGDPDNAGMQYEGIDKELTVGGTVTYSFVNKVQKVRIHIKKENFDGFGATIRFAVYDQFDNYYGIVDVRNGVGYMEESYLRPMYASLPVPGTSIFIPVKYKVKELGFVDPTGKLYFPDRYAGLVESELQGADVSSDYAGDFCYDLLFELENKPDLGNINIQKKSEDGGIEGICFEISGWWYDDPEEYGGDGSYYEEPIGWDANGNSVYSVVVKTDRNGKVSALNANLYDANGNPLEGLPVYCLETSDGIISYKITELGYNNGDGTYTLPDRYVPNESVYYTLDEERSVTYTCENTLKKGKLQVVKTSEDGKVDGLWFNISGVTGNGNNIDIDVVTKEDGTSDVVENLPIYKYGTGANNELISYTITELGDKVYDDEGNWTGEYKLPNRYVTPTAKKVTLSNDETVVKTVSYKNRLVRGTVTLSKKDPNDNVLGGSVWQLYDEQTNEVVSFTQTGPNTFVYSENGNKTEVTTGSNAKFILNNLPFGNYYFKEVEAPAGFMPYAEKLYFSIMADEEIVELEHDFSVRDHKPLLPSTGGEGNSSNYLYGAIMFITSIIFISCGVKLKKKYKTVNGG